MIEIVVQVLHLLIDREPILVKKKNSSQLKHCSGINFRPIFARKNHALDICVAERTQLTQDPLSLKYQPLQGIRQSPLSFHFEKTETFINREQFAIFWFQTSAIFNRNLISNFAKERRIKTFFLICRIHKEQQNTAFSLCAFATVKQFTKRKKRKSARYQSNITTITHYSYCFVSQWIRTVNSRNHHPRAI